MRKLINTKIQDAEYSYITTLFDYKQNLFADISNNTYTKDSKVIIDLLLVLPNTYYSRFAIFNTNNKGKIILSSKLDTNVIPKYLLEIADEQLTNL